MPFVAPFAPVRSLAVPEILLEEQAQSNASSAIIKVRKVKVIFMTAVLVS